MKMSRVLLAALMTAMLAPALASAQDHPDQRRPDAHGPVQHRPMHDNHVPPGGPVHPGPFVSVDENHHHAWQRGERVPREYWDRQYVIDDWRSYNLAPPPRGYEWVGIGGDHLLIQIGTGVVFQIGM